MEPQLRLKLIPGWLPQENPNGPVTYVRGTGAEPGTLQFSVAQRRNGTPQNASEAALLSLCEKVTGKVEGRVQLSRTSGTCQFGLFASVTVKGEAPAYMQAWVLHNKVDFILVTHISYVDQPGPQEIKEANEIALLTGYS
jgi:hypothetical protein